jgi:hypothetical protein
MPGSVPEPSRLGTWSCTRILSDYSVHMNTSLLMVTAVLLLSGTEESLGRWQQASLFGKVTIVGQGALPGVRITLAGPNGTTATVTKADGVFRIDGVPAGVYRVTAELATYETTSEQITLKPGQSLEWSPALREVPPSSGSDPPEKFITAFVGPDPFDCGQHGGLANRAQLQASLDCALGAAKRKQPFLTVKRQIGVASWVEKGLLGGGDGAIFYFAYERGPCGLPVCPAQFWIERCGTPIVDVDMSQPYFSCRWPSPMSQSTTQRRFVGANWKGN